MKSVTFYPYDPQMRPGTIGADFEDGDPNHAYTLRYEDDEAERMGRDIIEWVNGNQQMGCQANIACTTCRKDFYCGYGPYSTREDRLSKNFPYSEHDGHDLWPYTEDHTHVDEDGDLCIEGQYESEKIIRGFSGFEKIDLSRETPKATDPARPSPPSADRQP